MDGLPCFYVEGITFWWFSSPVTAAKCWLIQHSNVSVRKRTVSWEESACHQPATPGERGPIPEWVSQAGLRPSAQGPPCRRRGWGGPSGRAFLALGPSATAASSWDEPRGAARGAGWTFFAPACPPAARPESRRLTPTVCAERPLPLCPCGQTRPGLRPPQRREPRSGNRHISLIHHLNYRPEDGSTAPHEGQGGAHAGRFLLRVGLAPWEQLQKGGWWGARPVQRWVPAGAPGVKGQPGRGGGEGRLEATAAGF